MVPLLCFPFALLNGVMSSTTGFARAGHFTGVLTNIGLLLGQLTNEVNNTPEIWWKLQKSFYLISCWACGAASQRWLFITLKATKWPMFQRAWVYLMFPGAGMVLLGCVRLVLQAQREQKVLDSVSEDGPTTPMTSSTTTRSNNRRAAARSHSVVDAMALKALQSLGQAGGFTLDMSLYPTRDDFHSSVAQSPAVMEMGDLHASEIPEEEEEEGISQGQATA